MQEKKEWSTTSLYAIMRAASKAMSHAVNADELAAPEGLVRYVLPLPLPLAPAAGASVLAEEAEVEAAPARVAAGVGAGVDSELDTKSHSGSMV